MRSRRIVLGFAAWLAVIPGQGWAQHNPAVHDMTSFMTKGAFTELDRDQARHRLTLQEIEAAGLDGRPTPVEKVLETMAKMEKLPGRVDEPLEVRGDMRVALTPNTTGEEAYSTCFFAMTYNGLVLSGAQQELVLVRPESRKELTPSKRRWNRERILSTRLFRLGYLAPDRILRHYREEIGTGEGHAVLVPKANVVMVTDTHEALEKLGARIDSEVVAAMGDPTSGGPGGGPSPPSGGAIASPECIHFYLLAFSRSHGIRFYPSQQRGTAARSYPEAAVWLSEQGYQTLSQEYRRINELIPVAREAVAQGWVDPRPDRTLTPAGQRRLEIQFGLVSPLPGADRARTTKKAARRKRP
jgi:hypothetical protein